MTEDRIREVIREEIENKLRVYVNFNDGFDYSRGYPVKNNLKIKVLYGSLYEVSKVHEDQCVLNINS